MRMVIPTLALAVISGIVCAAQQPAVAHDATHNYVGFDTNSYPGDAALPALRKHFAFAGYWLTNPPGDHQNSWTGKRQALLRNNFGFLVLANGKLEAEITKAKKRGTSSSALGQKDADAAIAAG